MIKLGSKVTDVVTGLSGMITQLQIEMNQNKYYLFQPRGLNPKDGSPVKRFWCVETRLQGGEIIPEPELPLEVLGTEVEDSASGFAGIASALCLHINGCVDVTVQPQGKLKETGEVVAAHDFDTRRLIGKAIKSMTSQEKEVSQKRNPSPENFTRYEPKIND